MKFVHRVHPVVLAEAYVLHRDNVASYMAQIDKRIEDMEYDKRLLGKLDEKLEKLGKFSVGLPEDVSHEDAKVLRGMLPELRRYGAKARELSAQQAVTGVRMAFEFYLSEYERRPDAR